jgi:hypothetical protein
MTPFNFKVDAGFLAGAGFLALNYGEVNYNYQGHLIIQKEPRSMKGIVTGRMCGRFRTRAGGGEKARREP